jgi:transposase
MIGGMSTAIHTDQGTIERLDDIPLLLTLQQRIGLAAVIDQAIPRHWLSQGLSIGQLVVGWSTFILSEGDHRKMTVRDWAIDHRTVLEELLGAPIRDTDFTDDRLGQVLTHLSDDQAWPKVEEGVWQNSVQVYRLRPACARLDAATVNGYHTVTPEGLMQYGHSPDHPGQPQIKVMAGSVDIGSNGHLVAIDVVSGEKADDPLYRPLLQRLRQTLQEPGLLYLGDSKMGALATRADIVAHDDFYLVPLAEVGEVPQLLTQCVAKVVAGEQVTLIYSQDGPDESPHLLATGYETTRSQSYTSPEGHSLTWEERLLVLCSPGEAQKELAALERRLAKATQALLALTPEPGRGHRQIREESQLHQKGEAILAHFQVQGYLKYTFRREESTQTRYVGRGRGGKERAQRTITQVRYVITGVERDEAAITAAAQHLGWRLYATNQQSTVLPLEEAIRLYRQAPRMERHFHLFNAAPVGIEPLYVRRDDQIKGLTRLLSLGVRLLTLIEIVARRNLAQRGEKLAGLYEGNPKQQTDQPTATRLLKAFRHINRVHLNVAGQSVHYSTPLAPLQRQILSILELDDTIYQVPFQNSG